MKGGIVERGVTAPKPLGMKPIPVAKPIPLPPPPTSRKADSSSNDTKSSSVPFPSKASQSIAPKNSDTHSILEHQFSENDELIQNMSPEEIQEALAEITSLLSKDSIDFLTGKRPKKATPMIEASPITERLDADNMKLDDSDDEPPDLEPQTFSNKSPLPTLNSVAEGTVPATRESNNSSVNQQINHVDQGNEEMFDLDGKRVLSREEAFIIVANAMARQLPVLTSLNPDILLSISNIILTNFSKEHFLWKDDIDEGNYFSLNRAIEMSRSQVKMQMISSYQILRGVLLRRDLVVNAPTYATQPLVHQDTHHYNHPLASARLLIFQQFAAVYQQTSTEITRYLSSNPTLVTNLASNSTSSTSPSTSSSSIVTTLLYSALLSLCATDLPTSISKLMLFGWRAAASYNPTLLTARLSCLREYVTSATEHHYALLLTQLYDDFQQPRYVSPHINRPRISYEQWHLDRVESLEFILRELKKKRHQQDNNGNEIMREDDEEDELDEEMTGLEALAPGLTDEDKFILRNRWARVDIVAENEDFVALLHRMLTQSLDDENFRAPSAMCLEILHMLMVHGSQESREKLQQFIVHPLCSLVLSRCDNSHSNADSAGKKTTLSGDVLRVVQYPEVLSTLLPLASETFLQSRLVMMVNACHFSCTTNSLSSDISLRKHGFQHHTALFTAILHVINSAETQEYTHNHPQQVVKSSVAPPVLLTRVLAPLMDSVAWSEYFLSLQEVLLLHESNANTISVHLMRRYGEFGLQFFFHTLYAAVINTNASDSSSSTADSTAETAMLTTAVHKALATLQSFIETVSTAKNNNIASDNTPNVEIIKFKNALIERIMQYHLPLLMTLITTSKRTSSVSSMEYLGVLSAALPSWFTLLSHIHNNRRTTNNSRSVLSDHVQVCYVHLQRLLVADTRDANYQIMNICTNLTVSIEQLQLLTTTQQITPVTSTTSTISLQHNHDLLLSSIEELHQQLSYLYLLLSAAQNDSFTEHVQLRLLAVHQLLCSVFFRTSMIATFVEIMGRQHVSDGVFARFVSIKSQQLFALVYLFVFCSPLSTVNSSKDSESTENDFYTVGLQILTSVLQDNTGEILAYPFLKWFITHTLNSNNITSNNSKNNDNGKYHKNILAQVLYAIIAGDVRHSLRLRLNKHIDRKLSYHQHNNNYNVDDQKVLPMTCPTAAERELITWPLTKGIWLFRGLQTMSLTAFSAYVPVISRLLPINPIATSIDDNTSVVITTKSKSSCGVYWTVSDLAYGWHQIIRLLRREVAARWYPHHYDNNNSSDNNVKIDVKEEEKIVEEFEDNAYAATAALAGLASSVLHLCINSSNHNGIFNMEEELMQYFASDYLLTATASSKSSTSTAISTTNSANSAAKKGHSSVKKRVQDAAMTFYASILDNACNHTIGALDRLSTISLWLLSATATPLRIRKQLWQDVVAQQVVSLLLFPSNDYLVTNSNADITASNVDVSTANDGSGNNGVSLKEYRKLLAQLLLLQDQYYRAHYTHDTTSTKSALLVSSQLSYHQDLWQVVKAVRFSSFEVLQLLNLSDEDSDNSSAMALNALVVRYLMKPLVHFLLIGATTMIINEDKMIVVIENAWSIVLMQDICRDLVAITASINDVSWQQRLLCELLLQTVQGSFLDSKNINSSTMSQVAIEDVLHISPSTKLSSVKIEELSSSSSPLPANSVSKLLLSLRQLLQA